MNGKITNSSSYSQITISGDGRAHLGNQYNFTQIRQEWPSEREVIRGIGSSTKLFHVFDFSVGVACALRRHISQQEPIVQLGPDIKDLEKYSQWVEILPSASNHELSGEYNGMQLSKRCHVCLVEAKDMLSVLKDVYATAQQRQYAAPSEPPPYPGLGQETAEPLLRERLEEQLDRARVNNKCLAKHLVSRFWPERLRETALENEEECVSSVKRIAEMLKQDLDKGVEAILCHLSFDRMNERWQTLPDAHPRTFSWTLSTDQLQLRTWLSSGRGIYWIAGKAGSGKSILMKYLCAQAETKSLLDLWGPSCDYDLSVLSFYFWFGGVLLQRSPEGLLRCILHQLIREAPALAFIAYPDSFNRTQMRATIDLDHERLQDVFQRVRKHRFHSKSRRLCVFIDGLDECDGNHQMLIQLLADLAKDEDIKLCVASRPWTPFRRSYEGKAHIQSFRLDEMTHEDIGLYVKESITSFITSLDIPDATSETLEAAPQSQYVADAGSLVDLIVERAEGVFLWVYLVVDSVLRGIAAGDSCKDLEARVAELPTELDQYFEIMLNRVEATYRRRSNQHLKLALLYTQEGEHAQNVSSWLDHWLISKSPAGIETDSVYETLDRYDMRRMQDELRDNLNASCKDLLHLPRGLASKSATSAARPESPSLSLRVLWLHRTVYDFLVQQRMMNKVDGGVPSHFNSKDVFQHVWLLRCQRLHWYGPDAKIRADQLVKLAFSRQHTVSHDQYLGHFDRALLTLYKQSGDPQASRANPAGFRDEAGLIALAKLVAFKKTDYVNEFFDTLVSTRSTLGRLQSFMGPMLLAMIGEDLSNRFRLCDIDVKLMATILNMEGILDEKVYDSGCNRTLRQVFWRKWARTMSRPLPMPLDRVPLEHCWKIASLVLEKTSDLDEIYCTAPVDETRHVHSRVELRQILKMTLSKDQLSMIRKIVPERRGLRDRFKLKRKERWPS